MRERSKSRSLSPIPDDFAFPNPLIGIETTIPDPTAAESAEKDRIEIEKLIEVSSSSPYSDNEVCI